MRGPAPTPTAIKQLTGQYIRAGDEPAIPALADITPPQWLTGRAAVVWLELAPTFADVGVLTLADTTAFSMVCQAVADYRLALARRGDDLTTVSESGHSVLSGENLAVSMAFKQLMQALKEFGATPSARARISVKPDAPNLADQLQTFMMRRSIGAPQP